MTSTTIDTAGHSLSPSRARENGLIVALLAGETVQAAAAAIGVSKRTVYRMRERESFQRAYSAAKAELLTGGITKLHGCFLDFVTTLHGLAIDPKAQPNARVSASREGIAALYRGIEIFDFEERLRKLEQTTGGGEK
jgi:hypothetical protein